MNYAINEDKWCDGNSNPLLSEPSLSGIQYSVVTDLTTEPVTIDDFKLWARIDWNTEDSELGRILKEARQYLEAFTQKSFGEKTIKLTALNLPKNYRLMMGPVASITTAGYDSLGDILKGGPYTDIEIEFTTEWPNMPECISVAIFMHAAGKYMNREDRYFSINGTVQDPSTWLSLAEKEVLRFANISWP